MSAAGIFEIEEGDIAKLLPQSGLLERSGYVNIGPFSLFINLAADGNLVVEIHPRGAEGEALAAASLSKSEVLAAGGTDYDIDEEGEECEGDLGQVS